MERSELEIHVSSRVRRWMRKREVNDNTCISDLENWQMVKGRLGAEVEGDQEFGIYHFEIPIRQPGYIHEELRERSFIGPKVIR